MATGLITNFEDNGQPQDFLFTTLRRQGQGRGKKKSILLNKRRPCLFLLEQPWRKSRCLSRKSLKILKT